MKEVERKIPYISRKTENGTEKTLLRTFSILNIFYICVCKSEDDLQVARIGPLLSLFGFPGWNSLPRPGWS